jgi:hypothetical protein
VEETGARRGSDDTALPVLPVQYSVESETVRELLCGSRSRCVTDDDSVGVSRSLASPYTSRETVVDVGPLRAMADRENPLPLPPVPGIAAMAGGWCC